MGDLKEDIASATKEVVAGFSNEKSAPFLLIFLLVFICVGFFSLVTYFVFQNSGQNNKYYLDSITTNAQAANNEVKVLTENISTAKSEFSAFRSELKDYKNAQTEIQNSIKDHEKRLIKIEVKENIR